MELEAKIKCNATSEKIMLAHKWWSIIEESPNSIQHTSNK